MKKFTIILSALLICVIFLNLCNLCTGQINLPDTVIIEHNTTLSCSSWQFSFVQLTDVHIGEGAPDDDYGSPGYNDTMPVGDIGDPAIRLRNIVNWLNQNANDLKIKFVIITGDLTHCGEMSEFYKFREILNSLTIPYIPLIGNHDVWPYASSVESPSPNGDSIFNTIFAEHFDTLQATFTGWDNGTRLTRVWNADQACYSYLQNFSFEYENYFFVLADFGTREHAPLFFSGVSPEAELLDFPGGTWQWFKQQIADYPSKAEKNILIFTHFPPTKDPLGPVSAFSYGEYDSITNYLDIYKDSIGIWFAGHLHRDKVYGVSTWDLSSTVALGAETNANKDFDDGHFRIVKVWGVNYDTFTFPQMNTICNGDSVFIAGAWRTTAGTYYDSLTSIDGCDSIIATTLSVINLTYNIGNDTTIYTYETITLNAGSGYTDYLWNDSTTNSTLTVDGSIAGEGTHTYYATVTDSNGCSYSDTILITVTEGGTGVGSIISNKIIQIYPNPNRGVFTITANCEFPRITNVQIKVYDVLGQVIYQSEIYDTQSEIDLSIYPSGIYNLLIIMHERLENGRIIIE
ncbi:MAG: metallophosphoesterase [Bacteroidota bacterium]